MDTALSQATSSGDRGALSIDQSNETDNDNDESSVKMECLNSSFYGNRAGERGGSLYSTVVRNPWFSASNLFPAI